MARGESDPVHPQVFHLPLKDPPSDIFHDILEYILDIGEGLVHIICQYFTAVLWIVKAGPATGQYARPLDFTFVTHPDGNFLIHPDGEVKRIAHFFRWIKWAKDFKRGFLYLTRP